MPFQPDAQHMIDVVTNRRPTRLPIYEHSISPKIMEQVLMSALPSWREATGTT